MRVWEQWDPPLCICLVGGQKVRRFKRTKAVQGVLEMSRRGTIPHMLSTDSKCGGGKGCSISCRFLPRHKQKPKRASLCPLPAGHQTPSAPSSPLHHPLPHYGIRHPLPPSLPLTDRASGAWHLHALLGWLGKEGACIGGQAAQQAVRAHVHACAL